MGSATSGGTRKARCCCFLAHAWRTERFHEVRIVLVAMPQNTRSRTAAIARFRANLTSVIHRLPNELMAHIFVMGSPPPNHKLEGIDTAPFRYQVLVGSICRLWRNIAHECPSLWTSVAVFYPLRAFQGKKTPLEFYEEMICVILGRSGTLQLDLSVRFHRLPNVSGVAHYNHIIAHLRRAHILDVEFEYSVDFPLFTHTRELLHLRHLYAKRHASRGGSFSPSFGEKSPLETLYCETSQPFHVSTLPTSRLRYCRISQGHISKQTAQFINKCRKLRVLDMWGRTWEPAVLIPSSTLTRLVLHAWRVLPLYGPLAQGLPNLLHLRLRVDDALESRLPIHPPSWTPLPSLRSLSIEFGRASHQCVSLGSLLIEILRGAPQLVALRIDEIDAREVIEFIGTHREEEIGDGRRRKPLRLLILMTNSQGAKTWGDLPDIAPLLHSWDPDVQTEWRLQKCNSPIKIGGGEVRRGSYDAAFRTPLSVLADQIAD